MDGVDAVRLLAHHELRVSELAVRDSGVNRWDFLRLDLAQDRFDLCVGDCACASGCDLAFLVSDGVRAHR